MDSPGDTFILSDFLKTKIKEQLDSYKQNVVTKNQPAKIKVQKIEQKKIIQQKRKKKVFSKNIKHLDVVVSKDQDQLGMEIEQVEQLEDRNYLKPSDLTPNELTTDKDDMRIIQISQELLCELCNTNIKDQFNEQEKLSNHLEQEYDIGGVPICKYKLQNILMNLNNEENKEKSTLFLDTLSDGTQRLRIGDKNVKIKQSQLNLNGFMSLIEINRFKNSYHEIGKLNHFFVALEDD